MTRFRLGFLTLAAAVGVSAALSGIELDPTFGSRGIASGPFGVDLTGLALQADGSLVTVGTGEAGQGIAMVRFARSGTVDASFGSGGVATSFTSSNVSPRAIAIQRDGRIVVAGFSISSLVSSFFVARYRSNGSLDPSFGSGGFVTTSLTSEGDAAASVVLQPDGRIVVAGSGGPTIFTFPQNFEVVRYNPDGSLDSSYGTGGSVIVNMGAPAVGAVLRTDGGLIIAGSTNPPSGPGRLALLALLPSGAPDPAFGSGGQVFTQIGTLFTVCYAIALARDGKVVVAGAGESPPIPFVTFVRYGADGSLDPTFASGGVFTINFDSLGGTPTAVAVDRENRVLATAEIGECFGLLRLRANGTEDPGLGPQGFTIAPCANGGQESASPAALVVQPDGGIVIGGTQEILGAGYVELVRYVDATTAVPALSARATVVLAIALGMAGLLAMRRSLTP